MPLSKDGVEAACFYGQLDLANRLYKEASYGPLNQGIWVNFLAIAALSLPKVPSFKASLLKAVRAHKAMNFDLHHAVTLCLHVAARAYEPRALSTHLAKCQPEIAQPAPGGFAPLGQATGEGGRIPSVPKLLRKFARNYGTEILQIPCKNFGAQKIIPRRFL